MMRTIFRRGSGGFGAQSFFLQKMLGCDWIVLRCVFSFLFFSFRFTQLTSLGQMAAVKATLPVHFRHGMQWQKVS